MNSLDKTDYLKFPSNESWTQPGEIAACVALKKKKKDIIMYIINCIFMPNI